MLKTLVISFLVILLVAGIALMVWTIVDAHQRQRNNQPRRKYWFAYLMAATIGIIAPIRFVLSTPAFITLSSLAITTLFVLRWWMLKGPLAYRKEPLAYIPFGLISLLIAVVFTFIRLADIGSSVIVAVFCVGIAGVGVLLKTDFIMGNTPQHYYRAGISTIILGAAFACLSPWEPLALLPTGILLVIYGLFCYWYAHFLANKTKHKLTEVFLDKGAVKKKDLYALVINFLAILAITVYDIVCTVLIYMHRPIDYSKATTFMESFVIGISMLLALLVFTVIYKNRRK